MENVDTGILQREIGIIMKPPNSTVTYLARLVSSGFKGAASVGRVTFREEPASSVLSRSAQDSWKPAAIGACIGVLATVWKRDPKLSTALWGGFMGSALGLTG